MTNFLFFAKLCLLLHLNHKQIPNLSLSILFPNTRQDTSAGLGLLWICISGEPTDVLF